MPKEPTENRNSLMKEVFRKEIDETTLIVGERGTFKGHPGFSVRKWYRTESGRWAPGKHGMWLKSEDEVIGVFQCMQEFLDPGTWTEEDDA